MTPVEFARSQIGKPWAHQARGPHFWDCAGLLTAAFAPYGIRDRTDYGPDPRNGELERAVAEQFGRPIAMAPMPMDQMRECDVVLLAFPSVVRHVGIVANYWGGGFSIIHTWAGGPRCVTETRLDEVWMKRAKVLHRLEAAL